MAFDTWQELLPGCFGVVDHKFARHPIDRERAREMFQAAWRAKAGWSEIEQRAREFLAERGASEEHIEKEIGLMRHAPMLFLD